MKFRRSTHLIRGWAVLLVVIMVYVGGRSLFMPEGFGEYGHYRAGALEEIADQEPLFQGREICYECHDDIVDLVKKDTHHSVSCGDCHGPALKHVAYQSGEDDEGITEEDAALPKNKDRSLCLFCHRRLRGKPRFFPQIDQESHYTFLKLKDRSVDCVECHSPHEPIFLLTEFSSARLHPVITECFHCHDPVPEQSIADVGDHPPMFFCNDCHQALSEDFENRPHSFVKCGTCHQFTKVSDTAGRIFKNGNIRFCLLCHEEKPFKDGDAVPLIRWPAHLDDEQVDEADREMTCIECHWEQIHMMKENLPKEGADR